MLRIAKPDDFHVHFRRGEILEIVVPHTARQFARALVMPNTDPPILTVQDAILYYEEIIQKRQEQDFTPLMTIQITDHTTPEIINDARDFVTAGKIYPQGVTTNSQNGVSDLQKLSSVFEKMQEVGMVLCLHGQIPNAYIMDREINFLPLVGILAKQFPNLRIVLEHISTKEAVEFIKEMPDTVAATITFHHMVLTLSDVLAWRDEYGRFGLNPHHYCQPIPQSLSDALALFGASVSGNPKFFFGSDSAPHKRGVKENSCGCAGIFTAPILVPMFAEILELLMSSTKRINFIKFISQFGAKFYGLPESNQTIDLIEEDWAVPSEYFGIVPFYAKRKLKWRI